MRTTRFSTTIAAACALWILAAPALAQQLPTGYQTSLHTAATQGDQQLLNMVRQLVSTQPTLAQSVVNEAAQLQPGLTDQIVQVANNALRTRAAVMQRAASRQPTPQGPSARALAGSSGGVSAGELIAGGLLLAGAGAAAAIAVTGNDNASTSPAAAEFSAQYGLTAIHAPASYAHGATGAGVLVGVVDSGIDTSHPEFVGRLAAGGQNFISGRTAGNIQDSPLDGHGTHVSGIIAANRNAAGMHGVAYDAQILPLRVFETVSATEDYTGSNADFAAAYTYGTAQGVQVFNGSYGSIGTPDIGAMQVHLDAIGTSIGAGAIAVFSTGNSSASNPSMPAAMPFIKPANDASGLYGNNSGARDYSSLANRLIAVAAAGTDGAIANYSNRCGVAATWCITAPGSSIYSTVPDHTYASFDGTSMAAPHVTGAVALLIDQYPSLTPAQIVNRIFTTATKTGIYSDSTVYGQGFLNLSAATSLVTSGLMMTGATISGPAFLLDNSSLAMAPAFGDGLAQALRGQQMAVVDSFDGAPIRMSADRIVEATAFSNTLDDGARRFGRRAEQLEVNDGMTTLSWRSVPGNRDHDARMEGRIITAFSPTTRVSIGYMDDPSLGFGLSGDGTVNTTESRAGGAFLSPYLAFAADGMNFTTETRWQGLTLRAGSFTGHGEDNKQAEAYGALSEVSFTPFTGSHVGVQAGFVSEGSTFLGSDSSGAFTLGRTTTSYGGLSGSVALTDKTDFVGSYFFGVSNIEAQAGSLVSGFNGVMSDSFTLGVIHHDLATTGDRVGLIVNQPLRVSSGTANLRLPSGVSRNFEVSYNNVDAPLAPSGREIDVEAFYAAPLDEGTSLNTSLMYRHQPDHIAGATGEAQVMMRVERKY